MISDLALSALWFGAGAAAAWKLTALHYRSRLSEATASEARYREWWIRDSGEMLIAKAQLDLIHEQHVAAGRKAHEPWKTLRRETTEKLMNCVAARDAIEPLEGDLASPSSAPRGFGSSAPFSSRPAARNGG